MAMTKKHYQATADVLRSVYQDYGVAESPDPLFHLAMKSLAGRMAVLFQVDNPRFDREKFMEACGFIDQPKEQEQSE